MSPSTTTSMRAACLCGLSKQPATPRAIAAPRRRIGMRLSVCRWSVAYLMRPAAWWPRASGPTTRAARN
ncbi:hypothetical protein [Lysobacter gummosus]|uniref:hypothetical protein n=1 Tax=Lysobacter gummosus TaxID=262324 RepID=UPI0036351272